MEDGKKASIPIKHCPWWIGVLEHLDSLSSQWALFEHLPGTKQCGKK